MTTLATRAWLRRALAVAAIGLGVVSVGSRITSFGDADLARNEFTQDYVSARALADGGDPYANAQTLVNRYLPGNSLYATPTPHSPIQLLMTRPLAALPYRAARGVWLLVEALAMAAGIALVVRGAGFRAGVAVPAGVAALALPVAQKELVYGNVNGILLLVLALAWRALRARDERAGGAWIGAAIALKLFPAFMLLPLLRMRLHRAVRWAVIVAIVLTVVGFGVVGLSRIAGYRAALAENSAFWRAAPINITLVGASFRWLADSRWHSGLISSDALATGAAALAVAACVLASLRTAASRTRDRFWAAAPWMILASPLAWDWYVVLALPAVALVVAASIRDGEPPGNLTVLALALLAIGIPPGLPVPGEPISNATLLLGYGLPTYGLALFGIADARAKVGASAPS